MNEKSIYQILGEIQSEFAVKKDQKNSFGNYNYRTAEGILSEVKPLLKEYNVCISLKEEILFLNNRYYIKCIATLFKNKEEFIEVFANAREPETKKGMSEEQITGGATSYARKYALCGLLAISEDIDDPDNENNRKSQYSEGFESAKAKLLNITDLKKLQESESRLKNSKLYSEEQKEKLLGIITDKINYLSKK